MSNIIFVDSPMIGNLRFTGNTRGWYKEMQPNFEVLSIDQGKTKQGYECYRLTATNETDGLKMTQVQYYFDLGERLFAITYSTR